VEVTVLTEGHNNDFFLMPYNVSPKTIFKLNEDTSNTLDAGQQTLSILGSWGYTADTLSVTTADAVGSTTTTSVSVTSAADLGPAQTILVDSEQLYITAISGNTLTVERGSTERRRRPIPEERVYSLRLPGPSRPGLS
jgi:VCBS repeat-containing protein